MLADTKVKMSSSKTKANRKTYGISSIIRVVTRKFHFVVVQDNGNCKSNLDRGLGNI